MGFRKMRRFKQQLSDEECRNILIQEPRGVLSVIGDDGYPYGVVLDHWYCPEDGRLYFHGATEGHKVDAIRTCDKVCYTVHDEGYREDGDWPLHIKSVVVFGRMAPVDDPERVKDICMRIARKFSDDEAYLEKELKHISRALCLELVPEHMTGKLVKES